MRFEWVQALVRIAIAKFLKPRNRATATHGAGKETPGAPALNIAVGKG